MYDRQDRDVSVVSYFTVQWVTQIWMAFVMKFIKLTSFCKFSDVTRSSLLTGGERSSYDIQIGIQISYAAD